MRGRATSTPRLLARAVLLAVVLPLPVWAQPGSSSLRVEVRSAAGPVAGADVVIAGVPYITDSDGLVLAMVPPGVVVVSVAVAGFIAVTRTLRLAAGDALTLLMDLQVLPVEEEVIVSATRTNRRLDDQPVRVEVLQREEIEEKMLMTPGDIVMMLNETGGLRVQATAPAIGAASIRVQGMKGRYTRFLADGLPLYGQQVGGLGLLQIPPMDLAQVEVIKGSASALYGSGAMGGVVNLVSRRPAREPEHELLLNRSTAGATDAVLYLSGPLGGVWAASFLGGGHWQSRHDADLDGWADLPAYGRGVLRPRLYWDDQAGRSGMVTAGVTYEDRRGGTIPDVVVPAIGLAHREALDTRRYDVAASTQFLAGGRYLVAIRGAAAWATRTHRLGEIGERSRHETVFGEIAIRGSRGRHVWVVGTALERDAYDPRDLPEFRYTFSVPGVFAQADVEPAPWLSVSASGRADLHSEYGSFFSPRVSALVRADRWTTRMSAGGGFFAPTPLVEETEAAGLSRLSIPNPLRPERGRSASLDVTRAAGWASYTATVFWSRVADPLDLERGDRYVLSNREDATTNIGMELLATAGAEPWSATASYTFVRSGEGERGRRVDVALTPRHSLGFVGMWEREDAGRVGVEVYYTSRQRLDDNPYRTVSEPYVVLGALVERRVGGVRVFLNLENLSDVRQTKWDPVVRPTRAADGRWTVDAWAPLDGRVINGGVRLSF